MKYLSLLILVLCAFVFSGCREKKPKYLTNDPFYIKATKLQQQGRLDEATKAFESSIKLGKSYAGHLQLSFIYEEKREFASQIYHCKKYLALANEKDKNIGLVNSLIKQAEEAQFLVLNQDFRPKLKAKEEQEKKEAEKKKSKYGEVTPRERLFKQKFVDEVKARRKAEEELAILRKSVEDNKSMTVAPKSTKQLTKPKAVVSEPKVVEQRPVVEPKVVKQAPKVTKSQVLKTMTVYKVMPGDSLSRISQKFYKTSTKWKLIVDANQPALSDPSKLRIGQEIIIPELPK